MTLKIISTIDTLFTGEVSLVILPGEAGEFTVLHNHASLISTLVAGKVRYEHEGVRQEIDVNGGVVDVDNNIVSVCVY